MFNQQRNWIQTPERQQMNCLCAAPISAVLFCFGGPTWRPAAAVIILFASVWGISGLTFCIPFAGQGDWNISKLYGLPCGRRIALDVCLGFSSTVWSSPGCIWLSVVFASVFMLLSFFLCAWGQPFRKCSVLHIYTFVYSMHDIPVHESTAELQRGVITAVHTCCLLHTVNTKDILILIWLFWFQWSALRIWLTSEWTHLFLLLLYDWTWTMLERTGRVWQKSVQEQTSGSWPWQTWWR